MKNSTISWSSKNLEPIYFIQEIVDFNVSSVKAVETLLRFRKNCGDIIHFLEVTDDPTKLELSEDTRDVFWKSRKETALTLFEAGYRYVGFNISIEHLLNEDWMSKAKELCGFLLLHYPTHGIVFEIVEASEGDEALERCLTQEINNLRSKGARFAIDDFGKLGSSLLRLCCLELEYVKIDRALVLSAMSSKFAARLLGSIVLECQAHNITVIAEGVETEEMSLVWRNLNVGLQQGYYFDRPRLHSADYTTDKCLSR